MKEQMCPMKFIYLIACILTILPSNTINKCKPEKYLLYKNYIVYQENFIKYNKCIPLDGKNFLVNTKSKQKIIFDSTITSILQIEIKKKKILIVLGHYGNSGHLLYIFEIGKSENLKLVKNGKIGSGNPIAFKVNKDSIYIFDRESENYGKQIYLTIYRYNPISNRVKKIVNKMLVANDDKNY